MKSLPILDVYVLSMLDRGLRSLYDLQRRANLSLGASTPAIKRLTKLGLVNRSTDRSHGKRTKYQLELTAEGRKTAQTAWRKLLDSLPPTDLDSTLRIVDMGLHYGAKTPKIIEFVNNAAGARILRSQLLTVVGGSRGVEISKYPQLRCECEIATLKAEAQALQKFANRLDGTPKGLRGRYIQESLRIPKS